MKNASISSPIASYTQTATIRQLHRTPRFSHSNKFSHFFSQRHLDQIDYAQGIVAFGYFVTTALLAWLLVLLILKLLIRGHRGSKSNKRSRLNCRNDCLSAQVIHVGFAAGGSVIDVQYIKRHARHLKPHLETMVKRSWRVQSIFLMVTLIIPIVVCLFATKGATAFYVGLYTAQSTYHEVERFTGTASHIVESLLKERDRIQQMDYDGVFSAERYCPNLDNNYNATLNTSVSVYFTNIGSQISATLDNMDRLVDDYVLHVRQGLTTVTQVTTSIDHSIALVEDNDWIPKFILMLLTVVDVFFLAGVFLTRCNIIFHPFRFMIVWLLMPMFILSLILIIICASTFGMMASVNADFCSGGQDFLISDTTDATNGIASMLGPKGTIEEIVLSHVTSKSDMMYRVFDYYMNACTTEDPFAIVNAFGPQLRSTINQANDVLRGVGEIGLEQISLACGADVTPFISGIQQIARSLGVVETSMHSALELTDCTTISPTINEFMHGATCDDTVHGLSWMFGSAMVLAILGLVLVTFRAALYNVTIRDGHKRTKAEETHREFKEYQQFMSEFYNDALQWTVHGGALKQDNMMDHPDGCLGIAPSFETGATSPSSNDDDVDDDDDDASHFSDECSIYMDDFDNDDDNKTTSGPNDDNNRVSSQRFETPRKRNLIGVKTRTTLSMMVPQIMTAEKLGHGILTLDEEWEPLSPPLQKPAIGNHGAPQKPLKALQRTSQRGTSA